MPTLQELESEIKSRGLSIDTEPNISSEPIQSQESLIANEMIQRGLDPEFDNGNYIGELRKIDRFSKDIENLKPRKFIPQNSTLSYGVQDSGTEQRIASYNQKLSELQERKKFIYDQFKKRNFTPDDIAMAVEIDRRIKPDIIESLKQTAGENIGGTGGAVAGAYLGVPLGPVGVFSGAVAGAAIGGVVGNAIQQKAEFGNVLPNEAIQSGKTQAAWEFGGRAIPIVIKTTAKGIVNAGTKVFRGKLSKEAMGMADELSKFGGNMPASGRTDSEWMSIFENLSRGGIGGSKEWDIIDAANNEAFVGMINSIAKESADVSVVKTTGIEQGTKGFNRIGSENIIPNQLDLTETSAGKSVLKAWGRGMEPFNDLGRGYQQLKLAEKFEPLYSKIDDMTGYEKKLVTKDVPSRILDESGKQTFTVPESGIETVGKVNINIKKMQKEAKKLLEDDAVAVKTGGKSLYEGKAREVLDTVVTWPEEIPFKLLRQYRSKWLGEVAQLSHESNVSEKVVADFATKAKETLFDPAAAKNMPQEARQLLTQTNKLYSRGEEILENLYTKNLMSKISKNPAVAVNALLPNGNSVDVIKRTKDSLVYDIFGQRDLAGEQAWNHLRATKLSVMIRKATSGLEGGRVFDEKAFESMIKSFGPDAAEELWGRKTLDNIRRVLRVQERTTQALTKGGRIGALTVQGVGASIAAGGAMTMLYGDSDSAKTGGAVMLAAGGTLVLGPHVFARLNMTDRGVKLLTEGFNMTPKSGEMIPFASRVIRELTRQDRTEQEAIEKTIRKQKMKESENRSRQAIFGGPGSFYGKEK